jgi:hypothetical protein
MLRNNSTTFPWLRSEGLPQWLYDTNIFDRSNTEIVGSNPTRGMGVGAFSLFVLLCAANGLATDWTPIQGALQTVYEIQNIRIISEWGQEIPRNEPLLQPRNEPLLQPVIL